MQINLEALIAALIRVAAAVYASFGIVAAITLLVTLPAMPKELGSTSGLVGRTVVVALAMHFGLGVAAYFASRPIARVVCSGLDEASE